MQVPPGVDRKILSYKEPTYWNINAVVEDFQRETSEYWEPDAPKYNYNALITLYLPCYSSQPGRKDTYNYDVMYNKAGINVDPLYRYCTEYKAREASEREKKDKGKRYLLPKSYLENVRRRHEDDYQDANYKDRLLPKVNGPMVPNKLRLTHVSRSAGERTSRQTGEVDFNGRKRDVVYGMTKGNVKVLCLSFRIDCEALGQPEQTEKYDEQEKMEEFINLCARYMRHACNDIFGNKSGTVALASKPSADDMFRAEVDDAFFYNLLHNVRTEMVPSPYTLKALSNTDLRRIWQNLGENEEDFDQRWEAFQAAWSTIPMGKSRLREVVCFQRSEKIVKYYCVVERKFRLVARVTRLVPGVGQVPTLKL